MPYETYMGTFKNENDHNLERKFGYKYRALKGIYPDAYKLPETEVSKAIDVFYDGDANEDVTTITDRVRDYTTAKEPEWKAKYFGQTPTPQENYSSTTIKYPSGFAQSGGSEIKLKAYFDGENFNVTDGTKLYGSFRAMSGNAQYQNKQATNVPNKGPIPEGNWLLKYSDIEDFTMPYDNNSKFLNSWGRRRIKLTPLMSEKDRFYRDGFYLHGSYNGRGSAGCIDLGLEMPNFSRIIDDYADDIPVEVKYKKEYW